MSEWKWGGKTVEFAFVEHEACGQERNVLIINPGGDSFKLNLYFRRRRERKRSGKYWGPMSHACCM